MPQPRRITWLVSMHRLQLFAVCLTVVHKDAEDLLPIFSYSLQFPTIQANIVRVGKQVYLLYKLPQIATRKQTRVSTAAAINTSIKSAFQYYTACDIPPPYAQSQPCSGFLLSFVLASVHLQPCTFAAGLWLTPAYEKMLRGAHGSCRNREARLRTEPSQTHRQGHLSQSANACQRSWRKTWSWSRHQAEF